MPPIISALGRWQQGGSGLLSYSVSLKPIVDWLYEAMLFFFLKKIIILFIVDDLFPKRIAQWMPSVVVHAFNPSTPEAGAGRFLSLRPAWSTK